MQRYDLLILDDQALGRAGLMEWVRNVDWIASACAFASSAEAIQHLEQKAAHAALVSLSLRNECGLDALALLKRRWPAMQILALCATADSLHVARAQQAGALGFVTSDDAAVELLEALQQVLRGLRHVSQSARLGMTGLGSTKTVFHAGIGSAVNLLSAKEREVLLLLGQGLSAREIAVRLGRSQKTVETHRIKLRERLGLKNNRLLLQFAARWSQLDGVSGPPLLVANTLGLRPQRGVLSNPPLAQSQSPQDAGQNPRPRRPAKFCPPDTTQFVERPRLFERMLGITRHAALWIEGGAGMGKSCLAASFARWLGAPVLWYRSDASDLDAVSYFARGAEAAEWVCGRPLDLPRFAYEPGQVSGVEVFAAHFFEQLYACLPEGCFLVIDNVPEHAGLAHVRIGCAAIAQRPQGIGLIFTSRGAAQSSFAELIEARQLETLPRPELSFTREEAHYLLPDLPPESVQRIHTISEGWPLAMVVMARGFREGVAWPDSCGPEPLIRYIGRELFHAVNPDVQRFLCAIAILPSVTTDQAAELSGDPQAARRLEALYRKNRLVSLQSSAPPTYRLHSLFRSFLMQQAETVLGDSGLLSLRLNAARLLAESGQQAEAMALLLQAKLWNQAVGFVDKWAESMTDHGRYATLLDWLQSLPHDEVKRRPWLQYWRAMAQAQVTGHRDEAGLERVHAEFAALGDLAGMASTSATALGLQLRTGVMRETTLLWHQRLFEALGKEAFQKTSASVQLRALIVGLRCEVWGLQRDHGQPAHRIANACLQLIEQGLEPGLASKVIDAGHALLSFAEVSGSLTLLEHTVALVQPWVDQAQVASFHAVNWYAALGSCRSSVQVPKGDGGGDLGDRDLERALELSRSENNHTLHFYVYFVQACCAWVASNHGRFLACVADMHRCSPNKSPHFSALGMAMLARAQLLQGHLALAKSTKEKLLALMSEVQLLPRSASICRIACAMVCLATEGAEEAQSLLPASPSLPSKWSEEMQAVHYALKALSALARNDGVDDALRQVFAWGRRREAAWVLAETPSFATTLCVEALQRGIETFNVQRCIQVQALAPPHDAPECWPWPLRIRCLGAVQVWVRDQAVEAAGKASRKPLDLLLLLCCAGEEGIAIRDALERLWPADAGREEEKRSALDMALHRLRRWIGIEGAVVNRLEHLSLAPQMVWTDVLALRRCIALIDSGQEWRRPEEARHQVDALMNSYKGPLVVSEPAVAWTLRARETLTLQFRRAVVRLGRKIESHGHWDAAVSLYSSALQRDDLYDLHHRNLARAHVQRNDPAAAQGAYLRYQRMLKIFAGAETHRPFEDWLIDS